MAEVTAARLTSIEVGVSVEEIGSQGDDNAGKKQQREGSERVDWRGMNWWELVRANAHTVLIGISLIVYYVATIVLYSNLEGWGVVDCIYFAVVVVTTVGYGDYLPTSDAAKIVTIVMAHFALIIVAFSITDLVKIVRDVTTRAMRLHEHNLGIFNKDAIKARRRCRSLFSFLFYIFILAVGTIVFATCIDWEENDGSAWLNGLYLTVITVTTIGFGDFSPADTHGLKMFGCFLMLIGIPAAASALTLLTQMVFGEMRDEVHLKVIQDRMTEEKFEAVNDFVKQMRATGVGNYRNQGDDLISRFEYLSFVLVQNEVIDVQHLQDVMRNFDEIDKTQTGFIGLSDVRSPSVQDAQRPSLLGKLPSLLGKPSSRTEVEI